DRRVRHALSAQVHLNGPSEMLREQWGVPDRSRDLYVITEQGRVVISAAGNSADLMKTVLPAATTRELFEREGRSVAHSRAHGREVVAVLRRVPQLRWATVAEMPRAAALREAGASRFRTVLLIATLLVVVGLLAFLGVLFITHQLVRLYDDAARLAARAQTDDTHTGRT